MGRLTGRTALVTGATSGIGRAFAVSVKAPFLLTAALAPAMLECGNGVIINVGRSMA